MVLVLGSQNSSNSQRLAELARETRRAGPSDRRARRHRPELVSRRRHGAGNRRRKHAPETVVEQCVKVPARTVRRGRRIAARSGRRKSISPCPRNSARWRRRRLRSRVAKGLRRHDRPPALRLLTANLAGSSSGKSFPSSAGRAAFSRRRRSTPGPASRPSSTTGKWRMRISRHQPHRVFDRIGRRAHGHVARHDVADTERRQRALVLGAARKYRAR